MIKKYRFFLFYPLYYDHLYFLILLVLTTQSSMVWYYCSACVTHYHTRNTALVRASGPNTRAIVFTSRGTLWSNPEGAYTRRNILTQQL